jgi:hypothetical protein
MAVPSGIPAPIEALREMVSPGVPSEAPMMVPSSVQVPPVGSKTSEPPTMVPSGVPMEIKAIQVVMSSGITQPPYAPCVKPLGFPVSTAGLKPAD